MRMAKNNVEHKWAEISFCQKALPKKIFKLVGTQSKHIFNYLLAEHLKAQKTCSRLKCKCKYALAFKE